MPATDQPATDQPATDQPATDQPASQLLAPDLRSVPAPTLFPEIYRRDPNHHGWAKGGYKAALEQLDRLEPERYGVERGFPHKYSTRLSPYLRHGVLSLAQARLEGLRRVPKTAPSKAWKYVNELSWRDYFVRLYRAVGAEIWQDFQPYKTGLGSNGYSQAFPADIKGASTGLNCIDSWSRELQETGYLHNHIRMWLASYIVHHRRIWWQGGARWFMTHLLDGDPAANNLNWQWVASTFRPYPYIWNRPNLQKYVGDRYCAQCPLKDSGCPFQGTYAALSERLFAGKKAAPGEVERMPLERLNGIPWQGPQTPQHLPGTTVVVWVHADRLSPLGEALSAYPESPALFVWDDELLAQWEISAKRITFLHESLAELPVHVSRGMVAEEVARFARAHGASAIATTASPSPRFDEIVLGLERMGLTVQVWPEPPFAVTTVPLDLTNHTAYWHQIKASAFGHEPGPSQPKPKARRTTPKLKRRVAPE